MPKTSRADDLRIPQDLRFQRREWAVQRVGWVGMAALILAALLGLFGRGPLATGRAQDAAGTLSAEYERFTRRSAPTTLRVTAEVDPGSDTVRVWLGRAYADANRIQSVEPEPVSVASGPDRLVYTFVVVPAPGEVSVPIEFDVEPQRAGGRAVRLGRVGGTELAFRQFVYP